VWYISLIICAGSTKQMDIVPCMNTKLIYFDYQIKTQLIHDMFLSSYSVNFRRKLLSAYEVYMR